MIVAYSLFLLLGIAAFFLLGKLETPVRVLLALAIFLIPSIALTAWVSYVGDKAPPGSVIVSPEANDQPRESGSDPRGSGGHSQPD
jgi:hypothetical protein